MMKKKLKSHVHSGENKAIKKFLNLMLIEDRYWREIKLKNKMVIKKFKF
jgi:hypothetical protein